MLLTVFTPVYNRAYIIKKLYESLKKQGFRDFEWLVVDDGSSDDLVAVMQNFIEDDERTFDIRFYQQDNRGKHTAINKGTDLANGEYFFIVDSDDRLTDNALKEVFRWIGATRNQPILCGVCGNKGYADDMIIGSTFSGDWRDSFYNDRTKHNIYGDKAEIYKTEILKKYPFPEFKGENFITESSVWNVIGNKYKLRYYNTIIYIADYLDDGLSKNMNRHILKNPKGHAYAIMIDNQYGKRSLKSRLGSYYYYGQLFSQILSREEIIANLQITKATYTLSNIIWSTVNKLKNR